MKGIPGDNFSVDDSVDPKLQVTTLPQLIEIH